MAIRLPENSHSPRLCTAIRSESDGYSSADKWLFSSGPMAIGLRMPIFFFFHPFCLFASKKYFPGTEIPQFYELYISYQSHFQ